MYTFIVTNMDSSPEYLVKFYCKRGLMENFIKESKSGFDFSAVSSHNRIVNANRVQVHALAYNIFNWFRRLVLSAKMRKQRIDTVRLKLLKIATKVDCYKSSSLRKIYHIHHNISYDFVYKNYLLIISINFYTTTGEKATYLSSRCYCHFIWIISIIYLFYALIPFLKIIFFI